MFSIYIHDLQKASKFETRFYADDTTLMLIETDLNELNKNENNELIKVESWLTSNKISLNYSTKTKYLLIKPRYNQFEYNDFKISVGGIKLDRCASTNTWD